MPMPKSVTKIKKGGVEFISNVDRAKYTLEELERAALRDVAKFLRKLVKARVPQDEGDLKKNIGTWVIKKETKMQIGVYDKQRAKKKGFNYAGYYAHIVEFGSKKTRAKPYLKQPVVENIDTIRRIEAQYLEKIEDELKAQALINEEEEIRDD